ncbi:MAG: hypothetical protein JXC32_12170, partial [Anaerolineae bacterium]|nr:hypothetical protein [Anaerolineae bacterium]
MQSKHAIVERSRQANRDLIDLTAYYTASLDEDWVGVPGGNLAALPQGVQVFAEAAFDMRGVIQLAGQATTPAKGRDFPSVVEGIKVNHQGRRLHFLHGAVGETDQDTRIGDYVLHYADGRTVEVPIIYQRQVRNWWTREGEPLPTDADIAWTG